MSRRKTVLTFDRAVDRFLAYLQDQRGARPATIAKYERVLAYTRDVLGEDIDPLEITEDDLLDVLATWRQLAPGTRRFRTSIIRSFFGWLAKRYHVANPAADLQLPRRTRRQRRRLTAREARQLIDAAQTDGERLVVMILTLTGIRRQELVDLHWSDVDLDERILRVYEGKGGKGRLVPIPTPLADELRDVRARLSEHAHLRGSEHVIKGRYGGKQGVSTSYSILRRLAREAGVDDTELGPHDLRRLYATVFLRANPSDLVRLQQILGHEDISTTRMYVADAEQASLRDASDRAFGEFVQRRIRLPRSEQEPPAGATTLAHSTGESGYPDPPDPEPGERKPGDELVRSDEDGES